MYSVKKLARRKIPSVIVQGQIILSEHNNIGMIRVTALHTSLVFVKWVAYGALKTKEVGLSSGH